MSYLPPPISSDVDLRHMPGYMIDVQSLLNSDLAAFGDPAANWFALLSWCASFHQVPAGSLPDDDAVLAYLVRLGRDVKTWKKMRAKGALRGWEKHADGRFYHPVVTKRVLELWGKSRAGKAAVAAREVKKNSQPIDIVDSGCIERSSNDDNSIQQNPIKGREGKGKERKGREISSDLAVAEPPLIQHLALVDVAHPPRKKRETVRTRVDLDWKLPDELRQYCRDRGWPEAAIDQQFEKFKNFHDGKGNLMVSWPSAWRTWVGNGYDLKRSASIGAPQPRRADSLIRGIMSHFTEESYND